MTDHPLRARCVAHYPRRLLDWGPIVACGVGHDGDFYAIAQRNSPSQRARSSGWIPRVMGKLRSAATHKPPQIGADCLLMRFGAGESRELRFGHVGIGPHHVQPYRNGVLIADARCRWTPEGAEANATLMAWDGQVVERFTIGDGVKDLLATRSGITWVSFYDEGVFGNYGWSHPGPAPIGASGLVAFGSDHSIVRSYDSDEAGTNAIADAYAINVIGDAEVWLYFYVEFPIVHWRDGRYRVWTTEVEGAAGLAVGRDRALLWGSYKRQSEARILKLREDGVAEMAAQLFVLDEKDQPVRCMRITGVADRLFFFAADRVLLLEGW